MGRGLMSRVDKEIFFKKVSQITFVLFVKKNILYQTTTSTQTTFIKEQFKHQPLNNKRVAFLF